MREVFLHGPREEELRALPAYELVRDYPELLPLLREMGVDPGEEGSRTLPEVIPGSGPWVPEFLARLAWRKLGVSPSATRGPPVGA